MALAGDGKGLVNARNPDRVAKNARDDRAGWGPYGESPFKPPLMGAATMTGQAGNRAGQNVYVTVCDPWNFRRTMRQSGKLTFWASGGAIGVKGHYEY